MKLGAMKLGAWALAVVLMACAPAAPEQPRPTAPAATQQRKTWTNVEVREHYLMLVARIGPANEQWKREGVSAEVRARRAYALRYDARMTCRSMMSDPKEVDDLRARDQRVFGHPDGPTFEELVEKQRSKGLSGDELYEAIVTSAQRTDPIINELVGPGP